VNDDEMEAQMEYWKSKAKAAEVENARLKAIVTRVCDAGVVTDSMWDELNAALGEDDT